jgi:Mg-chelatase subunit ChlD
MERTRRTQWIVGLTGAAIALSVVMGAARARRAHATSVAPVTTAPVTMPGTVPQVPEGSVQPATPRPQIAATTKRPRIEVVFALDTTGSMGGLLQGAKQKIWGIASHIASGQPTPEVKIGLVAYRDRGDDYVTRDYDLTGDLDTVYAHLAQFQAGGGGDTPEHVNKALYDAVHKMHWSKDAMKMIFLVGDAPPHMDYDDGYDYRTIAGEANQRGIVIHTIRCGGDPETGRVWAQIASRSQGTFASIDSSGGVVAVATPVDAKLAELSAKLGATAVVYGGDEDRRRVAAKVMTADAAPAAVQAERGAYLARSHAKLDEADLASSDAPIDMNGLAQDKLPASLKGMSAPEQKAFIANKREERRQLEKDIASLSAERDDYLKKEATRAGRADGFDAKVNKAIADQAKGFGVKYEPRATSK